MKSILFLTGTRADFGKLKSLMHEVEEHPDLECQVFITGMHTLKLYGYTANEVVGAGFSSTYTLINQHVGDHMEMILAHTVKGLSRYVHERRPDMLVIHGDRVEALAGAIVGALTNTLVCHIEGGERSGTIDESIRHSVSKLSHIHLVANDEASNRLMQMGELDNTIFNIGSPDIDVMTSKDLPHIEEVKSHYEIDFDDYGVVLFHPVTTDTTEKRKRNPVELVEALLSLDRKFVVIYPNNDDGSRYILEQYRRFQNHNNFRVFPSIRFESFLTLLKNARCLVGNSSAGVREATFYGLPSVDIGDRQNARYKARSITHTPYDRKLIVSSIEKAFVCARFEPDYYFGDGNSSQKFRRILLDDQIWETPRQKLFSDIPLGVPKER